MKIFIDTSALIAYYNADDKYHSEASEVMKKIKQGEISLTCFYLTDYIFDETITFIERVLGNHELALKVGEALQTSPYTTMIQVDEEIFREAWSFFKQNKGYSFTDCTSFQAMKKHSLNHAFTFDQHFRKAGFKTIP